MPGAVFVMASYNVPYTFTFVSGALEVMPAELEDAAAILGVGILVTDALRYFAAGAAGDHRRIHHVVPRGSRRSSVRRLFF